MPPSPSTLARQLISWFSHNGGYLSSDIQLAHDDSHGFHVVAAGPLSSPVLVSCPLKLTLSVLNLEPDRHDIRSVDSPLQRCRGKIPNHILSYLLLLDQRRIGDASPWHAYISCLPPPESLTTPLWFDQEDCTFLAGTSAAPAAQERKQQLLRQWEDAVAVLKDLQIPVADDINGEALLWAATIFTSRAFVSTHILPDIETVPILFPVLDLLNHSVSAKVEWDFHPHRSFTLKSLDGEHCKPGQEVFNNYAPKQNDELLLGYGFCLEDNPVEQFALKLAFPPMVQQYAHEMGLLHGKSVPFGMSPAFLDQDPKTEQHFLRTANHPFGRYDNHIPFFRGIPPFIVHFFFIQTVMMLDLDLAKVDVERPDPRITLQVLVLLHQAIEQRSRSLPLHLQQEPTNDKQRFAKIYRDGQAKILHAIREELQTAIDRLRRPEPACAPGSARLLSTADALSSLEIFSPERICTFRQGMEKHDLHDPQDEPMVWILLLLALTTSWLTMEHSDPPAPPAWLSPVLSHHPLPTLEDGIEDVPTYEFIDAHLGDFVSTARPASASSSPVEVLDHLGKTSRLARHRALISGPTEHLGARLIMWGMKVAEQDLAPVCEDGVVKKCLFVRPVVRGITGGELSVYEPLDDVAIRR